MIFLACRNTWWRYFDESHQQVYITILKPSIHSQCTSVRDLVIGHFWCKYKVLSPQTACGFIHDSLSMTSPIQSTIFSPIFSPGDLWFSLPLRNDFSYLIEVSNIFAGITRRVLFIFFHLILHFDAKTCLGIWLYVNFLSQELITGVFVDLLRPGPRNLGIAPIAPVGTCGGRWVAIQWQPCMVFYSHKTADRPDNRCIDKGLERKV